MRTVLAFAALLALAAPAGAQQDEVSRPPAPEKRAHAMADRLGLSPAQERKITNLLRLQDQEQEVLIEKIVERRRRTRLAIRALLSAEQKSGFDRMSAPPIVIGRQRDAGDAGDAPSGAASSSEGDDSHPGVLVDDDTHLPDQDADGPDDGTRGRGVPPARLPGQVQPPRPPMQPDGRGPRRRRPAPPPAYDDAAGPAQGGDDHVMVDRDSPAPDDSGGGDPSQR